MRSAKRILYAGPAFAGRETSLGQIKKALIVRPGVDLRQELNWSATFRVADSNHPVLSIGYLRYLSWRHYEDVSDAADDPLAVDELQFLSRVDGVIFVVDSQAPCHERNLLHLQKLQADLKRLDRDWEQIPLVFQLNKRDLENVLDVETLKQDLDWPGALYFEAIAPTGEGVMETFLGLSEIMGLEL